MSLTLRLAALALLVSPAAAQPPDWTAPAPGAFDGSMSVAAVLVVDGTERAEPGSRVAAFVGGEIRGVAGPTRVGTRSVFFLSVLGFAAEAGQPVEVRAYDAASGQTLDADAEVPGGGPLTLALESQAGTISAPVRIVTTVPTEGPGWRAPDPARFDGYATVTATVSLGGAEISSAGVRLAAFVGGEIRGAAVGHPTLVRGRRLLFLSVYADSDELAEAVTFRAYDPVTRAVYDVAETVTVGSAGAFGAYGRATAPFALTASGGVSASATVRRVGWHAFAPSVGGLTLGGFFGPFWTQGFPGADAAPSQPSLTNVLVWDADGTGQAFVAPTAGPGGAAVAEPGRGAFVYVFEDDDPTRPGVQGPFPKTLTVTGPPVAAPFDFAVPFTPSGRGDDGWNLLGNPFPTPIAWGGGDWTSRDVGATAYVWDGDGQRYRAWSAALGVGDLTGGVIPPLAAFWVQATGPAPALSVGVDAPSAAPRLGSTGAAGVVHLRAEALTDAGRQAEAFVALADGASAGLDVLDAAAPPPIGGGLALGTRPPGGGDPLAIQALPAEPGAWDLPVVLGGAERYRLTWPRLDLPAGWTATLADAATGARLDLGTGPGPTTSTAAATSRSRSRRPPPPATRRPPRRPGWTRPSRTPPPARSPSPSPCRPRRRSASPSTTRSAARSPCSSTARWRPARTARPSTPAASPRASTSSGSPRRPAPPAGRSSSRGRPRESAPDPASPRAGGGVRRAGRGAGPPAPLADLPDADLRTSPTRAAPATAGPGPGRRGRSAAGPRRPSRRTRSPGRFGATSSPA